MKGRKMQIEDIVGNKHISKKNAQLANAELVKIRQRYGRVTPKHVVAWARPPKNPLHQFFTWDNREAAHEHRLYEASALIRSIKLVIRTDPNATPTTVRAHISVVDPRGASYKPLVEVMSVEATRQALLTEALRELDTFRKKYAALSQLAVVFAAIEKAAAGTSSRKKSRKAA
jgi:hypothetical protein